MNQLYAITPTEMTDLDGILHMEQRMENQLWISPYSRQRHIQVIQGSTEFHFTLKSKTGQLLGYLILAKTEKEHNSIEFRRIVIHDKGKGFGRYCLKWIKEFCFEQLNVHRLWLDVFDDNAAALQLYISEGFIQEGLIRECMNIEGTKRSLVLLSMLRHEYENLDH